MSPAKRCKRFEDVEPLRDVSCTVRSGDVISVIGPSGTGKSTLLNLINRLEEPDHGSILLGGEDTLARGYDLSGPRRRIGMVFQSFNLFQHLTIVENIRYQLSRYLHILLKLDHVLDDLLIVAGLIAARFTALKNSVIALRVE